MLVDHAASSSSVGFSPAGMRTAMNRASSRKDCLRAGSVSFHSSSAVLIWGNGLHLVSQAGSSSAVATTRSGSCSADSLRTSLINRNSCQPDSPTLSSTTNGYAVRRQRRNRNLLEP